MRRDRRTKIAGANVRYEARRTWRKLRDQSPISQIMLQFHARVNDRKSYRCNGRSLCPSWSVVPTERESPAISLVVLVDLNLSRNGYEWPSEVVEDQRFPGHLGTIWQMHSPSRTHVAVGPRARRPPGPAIARSGKHRGRCATTHRTTLSVRARARTRRRSLAGIGGRDAQLSLAESLSYRRSIRPRSDPLTI